MNITEISERFPDELDAVKYFERLRWEEDMRCPYCNSRNIGNRQKDYRFFCKECNRSFSVTTGSKIHDTRLPLKKWMFGVSLVIQAKKGLSALQLSRDLGIGYQTAWNMYRIIREAVGDNKEKLSGVLEMDETYVGGKPRKPNKMLLSGSQMNQYDKELHNLKRNFDISEGTYKKPNRAFPSKRGRGTEKEPVVGIVERKGDVIAEVMNHTTASELRKMVEKHVKRSESVLITDEYKGYTQLDQIIEHISIDHQRMWSYRGLNTNTIESFWAILKRSIIGQYHHVSPKYLPDYVNEIVFKYDHRQDTDKMFDIICKKLINK